jgi:hypothetical protein
VARQGRVLQASDGRVKVVDERDGKVVSFSTSIYIHVTGGEVMTFSV